MKIRCFLILAMVVVLVGGVWDNSQAEPSIPQTPPALPRALPFPASTPGPSASASPLDLPPLKAVLVVGPIDGDYGPWTTEEKGYMDLAAAELEANGVTVLKFYTPDADWSQIVVAAEGAHFFMYRGHGVYWSPLPSPEVGGFSLSSGFVSSDDIRSQLHLAPNAIVMLYGCFTAGSASSDIDVEGISSAEAQRRVAQYSDPFFDIGAAGYYANWFGDAFQLFVRYLFQGMTLGEAYESYRDFEPDTVERYSHPDHPDLAMWLDKDYWWDEWQYNNAFAGTPDQTLANLFNSAEMAVSPPLVVYLADPGDPARSFSLHVDSSTLVDFTWTAAPAELGLAWLGLEPTSGLTGESFTVVLTPTGQAMGVYQTNVRVVADDPNVLNGEQLIPITLYITEQVHPVYLPLIGVAPPN